MFLSLSISKQSPLIVDCSLSFNSLQAFLYAVINFELKSIPSAFLFDKDAPIKVPPTPIK